MFRAVWLCPVANVYAMLVTHVGMAVLGEGGEGGGASGGVNFSCFPKITLCTAFFCSDPLLRGCFADVFLSFLPCWHAQLYTYST